LIGVASGFAIVWSVVVKEAFLWLSLLLHEVLAILEADKMLLSLRHLHLGVGKRLMILLQ
jgi:hypothetical protein